MYRIPFHKDEDFLSSSYKFQLENIPTLDNKTKQLATDCLRHYLLEYYYQNPLKHASIATILQEFSTHLKTQSMLSRQGFSHALGKLPHAILQENFSPVLESLLHCSQIQPETSLWAESRRDAIGAITSILEEKSITLENSKTWDNGIPISVLNPENIFQCLLENMEDYTTDKRGDIGSWVRDAAMRCIKVLTIKLAKAYKESNQSGTTVLDSPVIPQLIALVVKQSVEKIDNIRVRAGKIFSALLYHQDPPILQIPERASLLSIFPEDFVKTCNWRSTSQTFPRFVELLKFPVFTYPLLTGFVVSGGSLSDSVMKDANGAVKNYIHASGAMGDQEAIRVGDVLLKIFEDHLKVERVTLPLLKFISKLLQSNVLSPLISANPIFGSKLINLVKSEVINSSRVEKIVSAVELLCELLQGPMEVVKASLKRLMVYLCHNFPRVRLVTAQKLYESMITYGDESLDISPENMEEVMSILSETRWDIEISQLRPLRNRICDLLNVPQPSLLKPSGSLTKI